MKRILIILCRCFLLVLSADAMMLIEGRPGASDPCADMGASGTYDHWWNGEYSGDTDKACQDSGNSTVDALVATAGVIGAGGAINGSVGALIDADAEHIRWAAYDTDIDEAGTVQITVTTPSSYSHDQRLFEIFDSTASRYITGYYSDGTGSLYLYISSGASGFFYVSAPGTSTTVTLQFSWNDATDALAIKIGAGAWSIQTSDDFSDFGGAPEYYSIGEDNLASAGGTDGWKIDDFQIREGYEAS